jgi:hypothetical protein
MCDNLQFMIHAEYKQGDVKRNLLLQAEEKCLAVISVESNPYLSTACLGNIFRQCAKIAQDFESQFQLFQKVPASWCF